MVPAYAAAGHGCCRRCSLDLRGTDGGEDGWNGARGDCRGGSVHFVAVNSFGFWLTPQILFFIHLFVRLVDVRFFGQRKFRLMTRFFWKTRSIIAIDFAKKSWKSEPSLRFFGCLKISRFRGSPHVKWRADLVELWIFERYHEICLQKRTQKSKHSAFYDFLVEG